MSDLFKSAFGYFTSSNNPVVQNELVGQTVEIGYVKLRVKRVIAEGGFAFVYVAQALDSGKEYALKRLLAADEEANHRIVQEINTLKKLTGHPNIIQFIAASFIDKNQSTHGMKEYLILTELCGGGSLVEVLQKRGFPFPPEVVCRIMWQTCKAVQHMHSQSPPIIHRDLKIENLLLTIEGKIKICDFGSATSQIVRPDSSWSAQQHNMLEDQISSFTTPMYRAPEMVDTWENHEIGLSSDIWALGCLLYMLCYNKHPFEDSAKLRILNANYTLPSSDTKYRHFHPIIGQCLVTQPNRRLTISQLLEKLAAIAESLRISPSEAIPVDKPKPVGQSGPNQSGPALAESNSSPIHQPSSGSSRPAPSSPAQGRVATTNLNSTAGGLFSQIKGGAGSLLKNIKSTSTKVVQSVQQTMVRGEELAASYITSRICVVNYTEGPDSLQDMRSTIESHHNLANCAIYNLTPNMFPPSKFPNATIVESGWGKKCPSLQALYTLCEHMHHFLSSQPVNVCFVTCADGRSNSAMLVCGFLLYVGFVARPQDALQLFAVKRTPATIQPSHKRYLEYFAQIINSPEPTMTCPKVKVVAVTLQPVPLFNKIRSMFSWNLLDDTLDRDGCRPYIELYQGEDKVFSSQDEYERMTVFTISHAKVVLPVGFTVCGDVTISICHARQVLTRITSIKMLQIQFNTAFLSENVLTFTMSELDEVSDNSDHFQDKTSLLINMEMSGDNISTNTPWAKHTSLSPIILFTSKLESEETTDLFVPKQNKKPLPPRPAPPRPPPVSDPVQLPKEEENLNEIEQRKPERVETDDLLNLGEDQNSSAKTQLQSEISSTQSSSLFDSFITNNIGENISNTDCLLGDWEEVSKEEGGCSSSQTSFANFTNGITPNANFVPQLNLPNSASTTRVSSSPGLASHNRQNLSSLSNLSGIQRNVSSPNLQTDPFEEFITSPRSVSNANSPAKTPNEPNYSRSHFDAAKPQAPQPEKKPGDIFGDLLGSQGYAFSSKKEAGPRTINEMRREEQAKVTDPDKMKILDWSEGKTNNIRALLTSLHSVLWPEAKWSQCHMHQLVSTAEVKKAYRKACIAVHPDKHIGTTNEKMAKMIFMELNNAWSEFEKECS